MVMEELLIHFPQCHHDKFREAAPLNLNSSSLSCNISITEQMPRDAESQAPPHTCGIKICILIKSQNPLYQTGADGIPKLDAGVCIYE
jgi:hypothetical protein